MDFTLMTYNTHSSVGTDKKVSPGRIAEVITGCEPDIVCLQELDIGLRRTGSVDQAQFIADKLEMEYHFSPTIFIEEGLYGNAVLTRFPMRLVRAAALPGLPQRSNLEKRGALWVEIQVGALPIQVVAVHMGLDRNERIAQAMALTGNEWLKAPDCKSPVMLCGDLNALPRSPVHRIIKAFLRDAQRQAGHPRATWPSRCPVARIDYIYVSDDIKVYDCRVEHSRLTRLASDHLPLLARLGIPDIRGEDKGGR